MLGLQTKSGVLPVVACGSTSVKKIAGVELNPRLRRVDFHYTARLGITDAGGQAQLTRCAAHHKAVIVSLRFSR